MTRIYLFVGCLLCLGGLVRGASEEEAEQKVEWLPAMQAEVVIYGGTPSGISAAVAAAGEGRSVCLVEASARLGGNLVLGEQLQDAGDCRSQPAAELRARVRKFYADKYGADSLQAKACLDGSVFEPSEMEVILGQWLREWPKIEVLLGHVIHQAEQDRGQQLRELIFRAGEEEREARRVSGTIFIDASYEGDLAARAGALYRTARESRTGAEPHAGRQKAGNDGDGEEDAGIPAYGMALCVTREPANRVAVERPDNYDRGRYQNLLLDLRTGLAKELSDLMVVRPLPNEKALLTPRAFDGSRGAPKQSLYLPEANWEYPEGTPARRREIVEQHRRYAAGFLWFLQNDLEVPQSFRDKLKDWGLAADEWRASGHLPPAPMIGQGRRVWGEATVTEAHGKGTVDATAVAVSSSQFECLPVRSFDRERGSPEGQLEIAGSAFSVPYGALVPNIVQGLLVCGPVSATHVGFQALTPEPVRMALGHACGIAAGVAREWDVQVRYVPIFSLQQRLLATGAKILPDPCLAASEENLAALQFLGVRGFDVHPSRLDQAPTVGEGFVSVQRVFADMKWPITLQLKEDQAESVLRGRDLLQWLTELGWPAQLEMPEEVKTQPLTQRELAQWLYRCFQ